MRALALCVALLALQGCSEPARPKPGPEKPLFEPGRVVRHKADSRQGVVLYYSSGATERNQQVRVRFPANSRSSSDFYVSDYFYEFELEAAPQRAEAEPGKKP
jgi:hypothetical protein